MSPEVSLQLNWRASHDVLDSFTEELVDSERINGVKLEPRGYWFRGDFFHALHNNFYDIPRGDDLVAIPLSLPVSDRLVTRIAIKKFFGQIGDGLRGHAKRYPRFLDFVQALDALGEHFQDRQVEVTFEQRYSYAVVTRMQTDELVVSSP